MSVVQSVDSVALLPAYLAAGTAVLVLLVDLLLARPAARRSRRPRSARRSPPRSAPSLVGAGGDRRTFCVGADCSWIFGGRAALVGAVFALLTLGVLGLSVPALRAGPVAGRGVLLPARLLDDRRRGARRGRRPDHPDRRAWRR